MYNSTYRVRLDCPPLELCCLLKVLSEQFQNRPSTSNNSIFVISHQCMSCQTEVPSPSPTCIWLQLISHLSNQSNKPQLSLHMPALRLFWFQALERLIWKDFADILWLIIFLAHMFLWTALLGRSPPAPYISCRFLLASTLLIFIVFFLPIFPFG